MSHPSKRGAPASASFPVLLLVVLAIVVAVLAFGLGYLHHKSASSSTSAQAAAPTFSQHVESLGTAAAQTQLFVVGSLAPLGSFDYETSPLLTRLAVLDRHADGALKRHEISRDQAAEVLAKGDSAYAVIAQATRFCRPRAHSGKCGRDRRKAEQLLEQVRRQVQAIPDYTPGVSFAAQ